MEGKNLPKQDAVSSSLADFRISTATFSTLDMQIILKLKCPLFYDTLHELVTHFENNEIIYYLQGRFKPFRVRIHEIRQMSH